MAFSQASDKSDLQPIIAAIPLFADVTEELMNVVTTDMLKEYRDGDVVFSEGDQPRHLYIVLHGQIRITRDGIYLLTRQPYDVVGEQAIIDDTIRSATAWAQGAVQLLAIPRAAAEKLLDDPPFLRKLLRALSNKLSEATNDRAFRYKKEELLFAEFRAHVSDTVLNRLMSTGLNYGEPRFIDAIILLCDIRAFTDLSAEMDPSDVAAELRPYLDMVVDIVHRHEGMVDKFVGDAVMAIWGYAPTEGEPASLVLTCAQEIVTTAKQMTFGGKPISNGVGLNAGRVFIGNVGGDGKRQFTVLGSAVNLAARLESKCKEFGTEIVAGQDFYQRLSDTEQSELTARENIEIKGAPTQTVYTWVSTN